jgi:hypothetical protein
MVGVSLAAVVGESTGRFVMESLLEARPPDLDKAEGLIRMMFVKLSVRHLEWPKDRKQIELYHEVKGLASDALRAIGRHSDQKRSSDRIGDRND